MTKRPRQPNRTHPLDRDGDGAPGGSLPGNQTAPMAETPPADNGRDNADLLDTLQKLFPDHSSELTLDVVSAWTDEQYETVHIWLDADAPIPDFLAPYLPEPSPDEEAAKLDDDERFYARIIETPREEGEPVTYTADTNVPGLAIEADTPKEAYDLADSLGRELLADLGKSTSALDLTAFGDPAAEAAPVEAKPWARDNAELLDDLDLTALALTGKESGATIEVIAGWSDDEALAAYIWLNEKVMTSSVQLADDARPAILAPFFEPAATFSAEEIAAGQTPVSKEDEAEAVAAELGVVIDPADPIITVSTPTAPVAVRRRELQRLVDNRWLYKTEHGFSPNTHPPYIEAETASVWVSAGLAEWDATAGNHGGIRVTAEARSLLVRKPEAA